MSPADGPDGPRGPRRRGGPTRRDDPYRDDPNNVDPYSVDPYAADPRSVDRQPTDRQPADRRPVDRQPVDPYYADEYGPDQRASNRYRPDRPQANGYGDDRYQDRGRDGGRPADDGYPESGYRDPGRVDRGYRDRGYQDPANADQGHRDPRRADAGYRDERYQQAPRPQPHQQARERDERPRDARDEPYRDNRRPRPGAGGEPTRRLPATPRTPPPAPQQPPVPPTGRLPGPPSSPPPVPGDRTPGGRAEARPTTPVSRLPPRDGRRLGAHRTEGRRATPPPEPPRQQRARTDGEGRPIPPDRLVARTDRAVARASGRGGDETVAQPRPRRSGARQQPPQPRRDPGAQPRAGATGQQTRIQGSAGPAGRTPQGRTAAQRPSGKTGGKAGGKSLGRASGVMALGTIASRATGFLRTVAIAVTIGAGAVSNAYNVANTIPNIVYDLLIGGILTSVVVPVLVRATKEDPDGGERFASSLLTLMILLLGAACAVGMFLAPQIVNSYLHATGPDAAAARARGATFLRWFMPQILFYGVGATIGAILNVRGSFAAPMFTPVLNNLVVIVSCVAFAYVIAGPHPPQVQGPHTITNTQELVLAAGTTIGVVLMTIALLPALRKVGFRYRPRLDLTHPGLRGALRLAGWTFLWVIISQLGYLVITNLSTATNSFPVYTYAYQLFQLPYAIIGVSVITALLPRMSAHAADGDRALVLEDLSTATRLSLTAIVPAALFLLALGRPIAVGVFNHDAFGYQSALSVGDTLSAFAVALVPFSVFQLHLRVFYAHQDSRTPSLVNIGVVATNVTAAVVISHVLPPEHRALALALAFTVGYLVGLCVTCVLLRRRLGGMDGDRIIATLARISVAAGLGAAAASAVAHGLRNVLGNGFVGSFSAVLAGAIVGLPLFVGTVTRMGIPEVRALTRMVSRRFPRG
ncbi:murein biosynthesis integral membrane protein MurJ [Frankia sp. AgB1.9]|uniref:murein biosynthesis integral membrane protein MurJ n=1 Tax=unclassified Frankia TaxID=2632575 RepID=UPI0019324663|nr:MULTISPECIES: murein biosynthesis integral membrane protein MurJ [unclassified Frankia]MBL7489763.1 murein biosynthesis integral membrane protein MurJ [Frankia sp. AgW1.1]MBL7547526.1 murein biosynthesis integral membrane protein MurJ [Frankia sp. AgB1.9]